MKLSPLFLVLFFLVLICTKNAYAESYRCVGLDGEGNKINVLYDEETNSVNVNGHILEVESGTVGKNGVATEDFVTDDKSKSYYSLVVEDKSKIILRQFSSKDDTEEAVVPLACK